MDKKWIIIAICFGIVLGVIFGIYAYNNGSVVDTNIIETEKLAITNSRQDDNIVLSNSALETSSLNMNISPNAVIIKKTYYKNCDHLIKDVINIPDELVNKNEEDIIKEYSDWEVQGYSPKEIVLYKEIAGICDEHYVVKEHNGVIGIYIKNIKGMQELQEDTEISTQYLPEKDLENLKVGIEVVGKSNLNNLLEDYE